MANSHGDGKRRVRRHRSHTDLDAENLHKSRGKESLVTPEPDLAGVRRVRVERLEDRTSTDRTAAAAKMTSESHATLPSQKSSSSHRRRKEHHRDEEKSHRRRREPVSRDDSAYVYENSESKSKHSRVQVAERKILSDEESIESEEEEQSIQPESVKERPRKRKIKIVYITEEDYQSSKPKERTAKAKQLPESHTEREGSIRKPKTRHSHRKSAPEVAPASPPRRHTSTREPSSVSPPSLRRSNTTSSHVPSVKQYPPSLTTTNTSTRRSSFLGTFFGPTSPQHHREPERL
ncbi:hypothetical protein LSUE1_G009227 [Lachnellula suecica]|uniref:Uncharacterized protein n=1 Tax=Lachnellula suecica TaxID=602035 RepID=A0A8T9C179_9HELO|nr:hypothetical protein LSUE1_G009227 [Lachnellula suecica]